MIVDTQAITTIGVGAAKAQAEAGDTTIRIPNIVLPSIELIEPTQISPVTSQVMQVSFVRHTFASKTNDPGGSSVIGTLGKGLWYLRVSYKLRTLLAAPVPFNTNNNVVVLVCPVGGISANLGSLLPVQSGSIETRWENRLLLRESGEIRVLWEPTAVGDFLDYQVHIEAEKLL